MKRPVHTCLLPILFLLLIHSELLSQNCQSNFTYMLDGLAVHFMQQATASSTITSYLWNFGDGTTSTQANPTHTFSDSEDFIVCLTITTASGCTDQFCSDVEPCQLNISANIGACNNNGEVPLSAIITDVFGNAKNVNISLDGLLLSGSPFPIDIDLPVNIDMLINGDGQQHTITVVSTNNGACTVVYTFTSPDCGSDCFLSGLNVMLSQGAVKTVNIGDNFFSPANTTIVIGDLVRFNWTAGGHTSTSDVASGPDSWNSGLLGAGASYDVRIKNPGTHRYYCIPHGGPGGVGMSGMIAANCPPGNQFSIQVSFNTNQAGAQGYQLLIDNILQAGSPHAYTGTGLQTLTASLSGDGLEHTITIVDVADPACAQSRNFTAPDCGAAPACSMSISALQEGSCRPDSMVNVLVTINSINGSTGGFNLLLDSIMVAGPFAYSDTGINVVNLLVPGDGQSHMIGVRDVSIAGCQASTTFLSPNCTLPCQLSNLQLISGGSGNPVVHTVEVVDFSFVPADIQISLGDTVRFVWNGHIQHTTTSDASTGPDSWDSGLLGHGSVFDVVVTNEGLHPYYCIPHGAPGGIGMSGTITAGPPCNNGLVTVLASFSDFNSGALGYQVNVDGQLYPGGPFTYHASGLNNLSLAIPGDGQLHHVLIEDLEQATCTVSGTIQTPDCGPAAPCALSLAATQIQDCDNNNQIGVQLDIQHSQTGLLGYYVFVDGNVYQGSPFPYPGQAGFLDTIWIAGTGQLRTITVQDADSVQCSTSVQIATPQCGQVCQVQNLEVIAGPATHLIEVRDFAFVPSNIEVHTGDTVRFVWTGQIPHTSTSDAISGPGSWNSSLLTNGSTYDVVVTEPGNHPYYCIPHGGPGGIGMSGVIHALPACNNGYTDITIQFSVTNGSQQGYRIFYDGQLTAGLLAYDDPTGLNQANLTILGDGQQHIITIQDVDVNFCAASHTFMAPLCEQLCLIQNLQAVTGSAIKHRVEVKDFAFMPQHLQVRTGETIRFEWTGAIPHSVTSDATTGPDVFDSGIIGQGSVMELQLQQPGLHRYYCIPHGGPGGIGMSGDITATQNCEDGQVSVAVSFQVTSGSSQGFRIFVDGVLQPGGPFLYQNTMGQNQAIVQVPGDGLTHFITVQDLETPFCAATTSIQTINCNADCAIGNLNVQFPTPQKHIVEVRDFNFLPQQLTITAGDTVEWVWTGVIPHTTTSDAASGAGSWNSGLLGQGAHYSQVFNNPGTFPYYCIPHGGPGGIGMSGNIHVTPLCENGAINATVSFDAQGTGTEGYFVFVDGILQAGGPYPFASGLTNVFEIAINGDGSNHTIGIEDASNNNCSAGINILTPLCPNACQLAISATALGGCDNEDNVHFQAMIMGVNMGTAGFNIFIDNIPLAGNPYPYGAGGMTMLDLALPGDGQMHVISISDAQQATCSASTTVQSLHCGVTCSLAVNAVQSGVCTIDDQVPFALTIQSVAAGNGGFNVYVDGVLYAGSPFAYQSGGMSSVSILLPGDGMAHLVRISDVENPDCQASSSVPVPLCGASCAIGGFDIAINVPATHIVEVRDFDFYPSDITVAAGDTVRFVWTGQIPHTTTSDVLGQPDSWNSGLLGNGAIYNLVIHTLGDHPYYCIPHGSPGGIGMSGAIHVQNTCDDSMLNVRISFSASNGSFEGFTVYLDDDQFIYSGPYNLSGANQLDFEAPADGAQHHVIIQDAGDPACFLHEHFTMPDCSDPCFGFEARFTYHINPQTLEVQFTDASTGFPEGWMWMFGDGETSSEASPMHTYMPGTYIVCLAVENNQSGCMDIYCDTLTIGLLVCEPLFTIENDGLTVFFKDQSQTSQPINSWTWTLGNGQQIIGQEDNPVYTYPSLGIYQVCLTIQTDSCTATYCQELDLSNPCLAFQPDFSYSIDLENLTVQFSDQTMGTPHHWLWGFGDGVTSGLQNPVHAYASPGVYNICLLVQDTLNGCNKAYCELLYLGVTGVSAAGRTQRPLRVSPNPVSSSADLWHIAGFEQGETGRSLAYGIYDVHGRILQNGRLAILQEHTTLPVHSRMEAGMYVVEFISEDRVYIARVVVGD